METSGVDKNLVVLRELIEDPREVVDHGRGSALLCAVTDPWRSSARRPADRNPCAQKRVGLTGGDRCSQTPPIIFRRAGFAIEQRIAVDLRNEISDGRGEPIALTDLEIASLPLDFIESGLAVLAERADFDRAIRERTERLHRTARQCVASAGLPASAIDTLFLTGGSSRVPAVHAAIARAAPSARIAGGADFLSVALGLTEIAALRR